MKNSKILIASGIIFGLILSLIAIISVSQAAPNENSKKPNFQKPLSATDVELIKKVTLKGKPVGKGKPQEQAATGILGATTTGEKYAIVIGISNYPGTENDLRYADEDAKEMIVALESLYGFNSSNIYQFIDEGDGATTAIPSNATYGNITGAISEIKSKSDVGEVVFFFSGHGGRGRAVDGDKEAIDESIVVHDGDKLVHFWDGDLKKQFDGFPTSRIVFIFDSCVAGGMTDLKASGRVINMATTESGTAYEGIYGSGEEGNGQFTYYFADKGILGGLADKYNHDDDTTLGEGNDVVIEEAFDYAKANSENQTPTISDLFEEDLLL